jgi:hypothetical protein
MSTAVLYSTVVPYGKCDELNRYLQSTLVQVVQILVLLYNFSPSPFYSSVASHDNGQLYSYFYCTINLDCTFHDLTYSYKVVESRWYQIHLNIRDQWSVAITVRYGTGRQYGKQYCTSTVQPGN